MKTFETINPATEEVLNVYPIMSQQEVDSVLKEMAKTQEAWQHTSLSTRQQKMHKLADLIEAQVESLAEIITLEMGKPITQAKGEILKCVTLCRYYAENAEALLKPQQIQTERRKSYRCFEPLGIIFAIMPWNFPFWQVLRFAVPNLMAGNAGVLKHAVNSTGAALALEKLFLEAGFLENLFRSIIIDVNLAPFVIEHPAVQGVTLTGSERAGMAVAQTAGRALKKCVLELGGSDPYLILEDADLDLAVEQCVLSRLSNAGQICIAAKRIIVVEAVYEAFMEKLIPAVEAYQCGDPMLAQTLLGPMARQDLQVQLDQQVKKCIALGASCLKGGAPLKGKGYYYPATVLTDLNKQMPAYQEELFGPVVCVFKVTNEAEAIAMANETAYGLGAAVFTRNLEKGEQIARHHLKAGTCNVNALVGSDPRLPFGGVKRSGFGRELAAEGIHEFMNIKTVVVA